MKNPFRRKDDENEGPEAFEMLLDQVSRLSDEETKNLVLGFSRELFYDTMLKDAANIARAFGCPPVSREVEEMEESQSRSRLERIEYALPFIAAFTHTVVDGLLAYQEDQLADEEQLRLLHEIMRQATMASATAAVSTLVDMGLLVIPGENHE